LGIHVTPESARLSHQLDETVYVGGEFSPLAFILVLNELAVILSACLKLVGHLIDAPEDRVALLTAAGEELEHCSTSWLRVTNYENRMEVDEVAELSHDPESNPVFLNVLHDRGVAVIVRDLPTIEVAGSTQLRLYVYQEDGVVIVPLFSTLKKANRFMESVPGTERANLSSLKLVINPILASDSDGCTVILNPKTEYERVLSTDDVVTLRSYNH
jgi:hypothetical protein